VVEEAAAQQFTPTMPIIYQYYRNGENQLVDSLAPVAGGRRAGWHPGKHLPGAAKEMGFVKCPFSGSHD